MQGIVQRNENNLTGHAGLATIPLVPTYAELYKLCTVRVATPHYTRCGEAKLVLNS